MQEFRRPIYLSGRLMMDDGMAPPEPVMMLLVCNGQPRPQGYSDAKGRFSISLGQNQQMFADASTGQPDGLGGIGGRGRNSGIGPNQGYTERDLMACEFTADLPGFRADRIQLAGRRIMDSPEVGTIILHRLSEVQGYTFSMTTANAPKEAKKAYDKGMDLVKKKKYEEAETQLRKAVEGYPKYAVAWFDLGQTLMSLKKSEDAEKAYQQAVESDSKFVKPHLQLLQLALNARDWQKIADRSDTVLKLNPFNYPQVWYMNGAANYNLKKLDVAEKAAREAVKLDTDHRNPRASHLLGIILADKGDYPGALDQMKGYLSFAPNAPDADVVKKQVAELERVTGVKATAQTPAAEKAKP
jgi:tetratricopeptide (TPR) repeat protein